MYINVNWEYIYLQKKAFKEKNFVVIVILTEQLLEKAEKKGFLSQLSHLK